MLYYRISLQNVTFKNINIILKFSDFNELENYFNTYSP